MEGMLSAIKLKSIPNGQSEKFKTVQMVMEVITKSAKSGNEFLRVEVGDRDASFIFNVFENSVIFNIFKTAKPGDVVCLEGITAYFNGNFSPTISTARIVTDQEVEAESWMILLRNCSKYSVESMERELNHLIDSISDEKLRATVRGVFEDVGSVFNTKVAGISMHHAYESGLLEHTIHVAQAGRMLLKLYTFVDYDLAMAGLLLHDIGKVLEYTDGRVTKRTEIGVLQGHLAIGYALVRDVGRKIGLKDKILERLEHILLSHHDLPEFGSVVRPATPEAFFVSLIDNVDAKMGMIEKLLSSTPHGEIFSEKHQGLDGRLLVSPVEH